MKAKNRKKLIVSLIKDDMINCKLVHGLGAIGLNPDEYLLHLSDTVFKLLGIPNTLEYEQLYESYLDLTKRAVNLDMENHPAELDKLALEIYGELISKKTNAS